MCGRGRGVEGGRGTSARKRNRLTEQREMHFSNVTVPCHPLHPEKEQCETEQSQEEHDSLIED